MQVKTNMNMYMLGRMSNLERLNVMCFAQFTDGELIELANELPNLRHLKASLLL